jgi:hypothetical protein
MRETHRGVVVSVEIPRELWVRVKHRAFDEGASFRRLTIEGLELRLRKKPRAKKGGTHG